MNNSTAKIAKQGKSEGRTPLRFAAIDQYVEDLIISPLEKKAPGRDFVEWGTGNQYPQYLSGLYGNVTTLRTIINGDVDFVAGNLVTLNVPADARHFAGGIMNAKGDTIRDQVKDLARDLDLFGGFALEVIRDKGGAIAELHYVPMDYLRCTPDNEVFYYSEHWEKRGKKDTVVLPRFLKDLDWDALTDEERQRHASSIFYVKNSRIGTYPQPKYAAAVKACEMERCIDDYHLNSINNNFEGSVLVNFNQGVPSDQQQEEVEEDFNEKFSGHQNAGRILFSWNKTKDTATTITPILSRDFGERYQALAEHSRQQIYCAFRAVPSLFGLPTASGFSTEEYEAAFKLYNRTQIQPMQRLIVESYERLLGPGVLTIKPFTLDGETESNIS